MNNSIRDNTKDLLVEVMRTKGQVPEDQARELAADIADRLGLDGPEGDRKGHAQCVVMYTAQGMTSLYYRPLHVGIVWMNFDVHDEGSLSTEVF
jgi:hypothetical protein